MVLKLKQFFLKYTPQIALFLIALVVAIVNYSPNTYLTGWDNLHPEYNLGLNIGRSLSAFWQEYQGVGLLGGMAHAADLPRQIMLIPIVALLPVQMARYISTFAYLVLGPIGAYSLLFYLLKRKAGAFAGALFYLLNLATVQAFYIPYETFVAFFGFLPLFIYSILLSLEKTSKKRFLFLFTIFLLGSTAFYVQTMFLVLLISCIPFALSYFLEKRKGSIKNITKTFATILVVSTFWLMPVIYFTLTNISIVAGNKINSISTVETQYMNQAFGDISSIAQLKGFWTNYIDGQGDSYDYLMRNWYSHFEDTKTIALSYLLFAAALVSMVLVFHLRKSVRYPYVYPVLLLIGIVMLTSGAGPLGALFSFVSAKVPLFGQLFRSSFTKWSLVAALSYSWGIGIFLTFIESLFNGKSKFIFTAVATLIFTLSTIFVSLPIFQGKLISDNMRLSLPKEYTSLFSYLKTQPAEQRIAQLPVQSFWGWNFYDWGYRGSGFLWYGIKQPILDRAFDVWSKENESFYNEFEHSWYRKDSDEVKAVLGKYDVSMVLVDKSIEVPGADPKGLGLENSSLVLENAGYKKVWEEGKLSLFKDISRGETFVSLLSNPTAINTDTWGRVDTGAKAFGSYISGDGGVVYPFSGVSSEKINAKYKTDFLNHQSINLTSSSLSGKSKLIIPEMKGETKLSGVVSYSESQIKISFTPLVSVTSGDDTLYEPTLDPLYIDTNKEYEKIALNLGSKTIYLNKGETTSFEGVSVNMSEPLFVEVFDASVKTKISLSDSFASQKMNTCWEREPGIGVVNESRSGDVLKVTTTDAVGCASYKIGSVPGNKHLMSISIPHRSDDLARPDFCTVIEGSSECLHDEVFYHSQTSKDWTIEKRDILVDAANTYWLVVSARPNDNAGKTWSIDYKAPFVEIISNIAEFKINPSYWTSLTTKKEINLPVATKTIEVSLPLSTQSFNPSFSGRGESFNCDLFKRGATNKTTSGISATFSSIGGGISCDYRVLTDIKTSEEYIIRIQGQTKKGRGPKIYLHNNATDRNDLEYLLSGSVFDNSFSVMRESSKENKISEYTLNYETRSFGNVEALNTINNLYVYEFPTTWLSSWYAQDNVSESTEKSSEIKIESNKAGTWFYEVNIPKGENRRSLSLYQGYNNGWVALSGLNPLPHEKLNSWANSWLLPKGISGKIYIIYLPQLIQFAALIFSGITILLIIIKKQGSKDV